MEISLLTVGKTGIPYIKEGISEYLKRLRRFLPYEIIELPDARKGRLSETEQKEAEADLILKNLNDNDHVVLLDEKGREYTSREFAALLERLMSSGRKRTVFVVGGPYGFSQRVYDRGNALMSLSKMTFNHEMVRLFFTEQIYRGVSILHGLPYHHD
ncbi:23S rRNA (pseudouridine(1915)-N(3))-methyltransferase RlmH [bacterium]|nr:23S rRNA (pseudouridine(1915)-N(3))-methyltransferase RlmH [Bacteroides sp.]MBD5386179.1 23S rRNA (pseudouridine(1915)-N(3))-methyltransferase RlmH [bacterium]